MSEFDGRITELYGERCPDHEPSCACCVVWGMRDQLEAQAKEIAELRAALAEIAAQAWGGNPKHDFCHPEGCDSPGIARKALANG